VVDIGEYSFVMCLGDQRTEVCVGMEGIPSADAVCDLLYQERREAAVDVFVDKDSGAVGAHLAGGEEVCGEAGVHGRIEVGIGEDDERGFPAEFKGYGF